MIAEYEKMRLDDIITKRINDRLMQTKEFKPENNIFMQGRSEEEEDLVAWLRSRFTLAGLIQNVERYYDTDSYIRQASKLGEKAQQLLLNRYLRLQLLSVDTNTEQQRFCLVDGCDKDKWKKLIAEGVLPTLIGDSRPGPIAG